MIAAGKRVILAEKYELLRLLGTGGTARVYLVWDLRLQKYWALKRSRSDLLPEEGKQVQEQLRRECRILRRLDYPAFPRVVDAFWEKDAFCIVMDFIQGTPLDVLLREEKRVSETRVRSWGLQLGWALAYLHSGNPPVVYRDLKPANILLTKKGTVRLVDFGAALEREDGEKTDTAGTRGYAPPEQYEGKADIRSDIYALGRTLYQLLTGADVIKQEEDVSAALQKSGVSRGLEAILVRCMQADPARRYQTCKELCRDLSHPERIGKKKRKHIRRGLGVAAAGLALLLATAGIFSGWKEKQVRAQTYEAGLQIPSAASYEEKKEGCLQAIELEPENSLGCIRLLELYEENGSFGETESREFLACYGKGEAGFSKEDPMYASLCYRAGIMYFNFYEGTGLPERIQRAWSFFEILHTLPDSVKEGVVPETAENFYRICSFYRRYIFRTAENKEASEEEYETLLEDIRELTEWPEELEEDEGIAALELYYAAAVLLYDRRVELKSVQISETELVGFLDKIQEKTENVPERGEYSGELKQKIQQICEECRDALERMEERKQ